MSVLGQPANFAHANVFHHEGKPVPIELSIATIPRDCCDPESAGPRQQGPDGGQRIRTTKNFQELGLYTMALENLPKLKDICDGTFPDPVHEGVHEEEDISCCTMLRSYQFSKYLQQFNKLNAEWSYKVSVLTQ
ncbi:hypothetical protein TNCV_4721931 [Trichonephila clavipes]|uniref:Uncharacterized protein n=1 Tax=Trichonephila clavipes TaxID=2585209 RepID=A0A8X6W6L9_TRICX|nr:hypothetical protein TNCV_4721931 [Trichonephila clavipes]